MRKTDDDTNTNHTGSAPPSATPRKLKRAPQRIAAEQSVPQGSAPPPAAQSGAGAAASPAAATAPQPQRKAAQPPSWGKRGAAKPPPSHAGQRTAAAKQGGKPQKPAQNPKAAAKSSQKAKQAAEKQAAEAKRAAKKANEQRAAKQYAAKKAAQQAAQQAAHPNVGATTGRPQGQRKPTRNAPHPVGVDAHIDPQPQRTTRPHAQSHPHNHAPLYNQDENQPNTPQTPQKGKRRRKNEKPITQASIRRRNRIRNFVAGLLVLVLVTVGIGYSVNLLFRVKTIEIQTPSGETPADTGVYTEDIILARLGISLDDHFFSFSTTAQAAALQEALPLLENIQVVRDYPNTIIVQVQPAVATYTMQITDGWVILSEGLHVMETTTTQPALLQLIGATPSTYVAGQSLAFVQTLEEAWYESLAEGDDVQAMVSAETQVRTDAQLETLTTVLAALEEAELLADVTAIDFNGEDGISFYYQDRIAVLVGTVNSLSYKLSIAQYILSNQNGDGCAATDTGLLDVSYQSADGTITTTFAAGTVTFPLVSAAQEEAEEEPEVEEDEAEAEDSEAEAEEAL